MEWMHDFEAILFDGDGVLFDSEELTLEAFSHAMAQWGLRFSREQLNPWVGVPTDVILNEVARVHGVLIPHDRFLKTRDDAYVEICLNRGEPHPRNGVMALLEWMAANGIGAAVGSNANREKLLFNLEQTGLLGRLTVRYSVDDVACGKPDPEMFLRAAQDLKVAPAKCVVMEDAVSGLRAAKRGGMIGVAVLGSLPQAMLEPEADMIFADPAAFLKAVRAFRGNP